MAPPRRRVVARSSPGTGAGSRRRTAGRRPADVRVGQAEVAVFAMRTAQLARSELVLITSQPCPGRPTGASSDLMTSTCPARLGGSSLAMENYPRSPARTTPPPGTSGRGRGCDGRTPAWPGRGRCQVVTVCPAAARSGGSSTPQEHPRQEARASQTVRHARVSSSSTEPKGQQVLSRLLAVGPLVAKPSSQGGSTPAGRQQRLVHWCSGGTRVIRRQTWPASKRAPASVLLPHPAQRRRPEAGRVATATGPWSAAAPAASGARRPGPRVLHSPHARGRARRRRQRRRRAAADLGGRSDGLVHAVAGHAPPSSPPLKAPRDEPRWRAGRSDVRLGPAARLFRRPRRVQGRATRLRVQEV
jgi:hypothetical protein